MSCLWFFCCFYFSFTDFAPTVGHCVHYCSLMISSGTAWSSFEGLETATNTEKRYPVQIRTISACTGLILLLSMVLNSDINS